MNKLDFTGQIINYLTVIDSETKIVNGRSRVKWNCECICGKVIQLESHSLKSSRQTSCGCHRINPESALNEIIHSYKKHAIKLGLTFELSKEHFLSLTQNSCFYCNKPPSNKKVLDKKTYRTEFIYSGIDRLNNDIGYLKTNCVSACFSCNQRKRTLNYKDFVEHLDRIIKYQNDKNN